MQNEGPGPRFEESEGARPSPLPGSDAYAGCTHINATLQLPQSITVGMREN